MQISYIKFRQISNFCLYWNWDLHDSSLIYQIFVSLQKDKLVWMVL